MSLVHNPELKIYVYTTPAEFPNIKVGQTNRAGGEEAVHERIKEQFSTANSSKEYILLWWGYTHITDHELRKHPLLAESRISKQREWHTCSLDDVKTALNEIILGIARKNNFPMREEQQECCNKAVDWYRQGGEKFLFNAKMRFGKTFTAYHLAKMMGFEKILILTHKPQVKSSWKDDVVNHVAFDGWEYHDAKDGAPSFDDTTVVFCSVQQATNTSGGSKKVKWMQDVDWDLVILDEEHYGTRTDKSLKLFSKITRKHTLHLSGTPYKALALGEFAEENMFSWTYTDEQKKRNLEKESNWATDVYRLLPRMYFNTFNIHPDVKKKAEDWEGEDAFTMGKMFGANEDGFIYPSMVQMFLDSLVDQTRHGSWSPWHSNSIDNSLLNHMFWMMDSSVDSVRAMTNMLKDHHFFSQYEIIMASGNDDTKDIQEVKTAIKQNSKTITVSCGRFSTGVTVPEWCSVFMLSGSSSPAEYFQTIFRCQSPWVERDRLTGKITKYKKEKCLVIDFNPQRTLEHIYEYCEMTAPDDVDTTERIKEFLDCASILEHGGNGIQEVTLNGIIEAFSSSQKSIGMFGCARATNAIFADENIIASLKGISKSKAKSLFLSISDNDLEVGKTSRDLTERQQKEKEKKAKNILQELAEKARTVTKRIPSYMFHSENEEKSCAAIVKSSSPLFEVFTGISTEDFAYMLEKGFFNEKWLDRCITDYALTLDQTSQFSLLKVA
jgi:superfamily II DNA or RNA helicase